MAPFVRIASEIRKLGIDYVVGKVCVLPCNPSGSRTQAAERRRGDSELRVRCSKAHS